MAASDVARGDAPPPNSALAGMTPVWGSTLASDTQSGGSCGGSPVLQCGQGIPHGRHVAIPDRDAASSVDSRETQRAFDLHSI